MINKLIRISAPHFVAGLIAYGSIGHYDYDDKPVPVHTTAPILHYMKSWTVGRIMRYCRLKGWQYEIWDNDGIVTRGPK